MKTELACSIQGRDWWKPVLGYLILAFALQAVGGFLVSKAGMPQPLQSILEILGSTVIQAVFAIKVLRIFVPSVTYGQKQLAFSGQTGEYLRLHLRGLLLSMITLGIYGPWYITRVRAYLAACVSMEESAFSFLGKGGRLLKLILLSYVLPLAVVVGLFGSIVFGVAYNLMEMNTGVWILLSSVFIIALLVIISAFVYYINKWSIDYQWRDWRISLNLSLTPAMNMIMGQLLITLLSLGIYAPAAGLRLFRFFAANTQVLQESGQKRRIVFSGQIGHGFLLIWGQLLLSAITLGVYLPWAYANVLRWFIGNISLENALLGE